jgi:uncharacterized protein (TIGR02757 family)
LSSEPDTRPALPDAEGLEELYRRYTRREYVHPDPLEFLYNYSSPADREIAGLVASSLAYGGVKQILQSVGTVLERLGSPRRTLMDSTRTELRDMFHGFTHRWTDGREMADLLWGARSVIERHGSLRSCFEGALTSAHDTVHPALCTFTAELVEPHDCDYNSLLPCPSRGSASKRLHLFLRWMVRNDRVDPDGWDGVPPLKLLMPLDVHMHRIVRRLGMTGRSSADLKTVFEVTRAFRRLAPEDPVRYDFALSRLGIRGDEEVEDALEELVE